MKIELDGILLSDTRSDSSGGIIEGRRVANVSVVDERNLVRHDVPGMQGSAFQDLGRTAVRIAFDGMIMGAGSKSVVEQIRSKFKAGKPVPFLSDLSSASDVSMVVIEAFVASEAAGAKDRYDYYIELKEHREPPAASAAPPGSTAATGKEGAEEGEKEEEEARAWAEGEADRSIGGVNVVTGKVLGADGRPVEGVRLTIRCSDGEHSVETDGNGVYRLENLPPG